MAYFLLSFFAFTVCTVGVCGLLQRLVRIDTVDYDVYHLWEEYGHTKEDYHF